jgi:hypothetical protein
MPFLFPYVIGMNSNKVGKNSTTKHHIYSKYFVKETQ